VTELLLLSNSRAPGMAFLEHASDAIGSILGDRARILFVPFASSDPVAYTELMRKALGGVGVRIDGLHESGDPARAVREAGAFFVGGGNTFRLLRALHRLNLLGGLRSAVRDGVPTWAPAPAPTWPVRRSARPTTCRSSSCPRCRRSG
jgi:dipeptidase E